jgi:type I restriction-modification system DNA methylase subunit/restriction endonuclease S subunit
MGRSTVHYADSETNNILKRLHNKLRPAGTPVQRVEYIIELLLLRIFEVKIQQDPEFAQLRAAFSGENDKLLFSELATLANDQILPALNQKFFPFYAHILGEARKVWKGNLATKVQDQLVLIEEVFSNSNFSNNVTSGNMAEIIGLVAELDKDRLLKTDLLGDAIESALSETGGTKDIGLHRTPDHIRQFMVALAAPAFDDRIFDPTVGTGGFMFDSFEYVMQGVSQDGHWPGPKSHSELAAWFKDWFTKHPVPMPSIETTTDFYRTGVGGIEYLGMVRKMAAINFYVRGLNPGNIQQGDALEKFGTEILPKSKTVILANPPFGAERDKESYPNVWSEYPTESETTILFVKLMLESLKVGGRCAVIVSEGFLTWDQNSARALRRALLDECDLKAVISLPQGVFVSKGGQGPKTSILYFVKGGHTRNVWFYKVTNDGYTMGTNRKQQPGCQFAEALDLFHRYVREGKPPPETRHSFCIPADWIKVLDPRVKHKIRGETRAEMSARAAEDKTKLTAKLDAQVVAKKLTATERKGRLAQHDELWLSKTENAIALKIERAHLYSFNLSNYRSTLIPAQLAAWKDFAATYIREDDPSKTLERQYRAIAAAAPDELDELISGLDPRHTLELDIARQFLTGISSELFTKHPHLRTLQEIIASQQKTPRVQLKELLEPVSRPLVLEEGRTYRRVTVKLYGKGVLLRDRVTVGDIKGDKWFQVNEGDLIYSKIDARNGAFGLVPEALAGGIVTNEFPIFAVKATECPPALLASLLASERFYGQIEAKVSGATGRRRFEPKDLLEMDVPLVPQTDQERVVTHLGRCATTMAGVEQLVDNWQLVVPTTDTCALVELSELITDSIYGSSDKAGYGDNGHPILRIGNIGFCDFNLSDIKRVELTAQEFRKYRLAKDDFLIVRSNGNPAFVGKCAVWNGPDDFVFASYLIRFRFDSARVIPRYVMFYLMSPAGRALLAPQAGGGTYNISASVFQTVKIPLPPLDEQHRIVAGLDAKMKLLAELRSLKEEAESSILHTINRIWES